MSSEFEKGRRSHYAMEDREETKPSEWLRGYDYGCDKLRIPFDHEMHEAHCPYRVSRKAARETDK